MSCPMIIALVRQGLPLIFAIVMMIILIRVLPKLWLCMHFLGNDMREAFGQTLVCKTHKAHKSEARFLFIVLLKQQ